MTAIKQTLETVHIGWKKCVGDFSVLCSERRDKSRTLHVCTQLSLQISHKDAPESSTKALWPFYHTDDKVQVQGGLLPHTGVSSATWVVKNIIEPLAISHVNSNQGTISDLNHAILTANTNTCECCQFILNPATKSVKDQAISCQKCGKNFHKKCTDRRKLRGGNWQKSL